MAYLVAKRFREHGCIAVEVEMGQILASLSTYLTLKTLERDIEIMTVSDHQAYQEYAPYEILNSEKEFINRVLEM